VTLYALSVICGLCAVMALPIVAVLVSDMLDLYGDRND
jgi:hypothetical protein